MGRMSPAAASTAFFILLCTLVWCSCNAVELVTGRHLLKNGTSDAAATQAACVPTKCAAEIAACLKDKTCAAGLACTTGCQTKSKSVAASLLCLNGCLYNYQIGNKPSERLNKCIFTCPPALPLVPNVCPVIKGGVSKTRLEELSGAYNSVLGMSTIYDCDPYQQLRFPGVGLSKSGQFQPFTLGWRQRFVKTQKNWSMDIKIVARTATTGAYKTQYNVAGITGTDTYQVIDVSEDKNYVLMVYCSYSGIAVSPGGYVLVKEGKGTKVPAAVLKRFASKFVASGWATLYKSDVTKWCPVAVYKFP